MAWHGMVEVCEGAPVAVSGWVLADRHDVRPCAASSLHRGTMSVSNVMGGMVNALTFACYIGMLHVAPGYDFFLGGGVLWPRGCTRDLRWS